MKLTDEQIDEFIEWHDARPSYIYPTNGSVARMHRQTAQALRELQSLRGKYADLLYQVAQKVPGESRHDTAKRIIYQHENRPGQGPEQGENPDLLRQEEI